jgi:MFS family permease
MLTRARTPVHERLPAPLRHRRFRNLFLGQSLSSFGDALIPVALAFAVIRTSGSSADLGLVLAAGIAPMVAFVLLGGVAGDRWPRQRVMLSADFVRCAVQATTALLLLVDRMHLWQLVLLQAAWGTAAAFFRPASSALVPQLLPAPEVQAGNALLGLTQSVAVVTAPAVSGLLVATIGPGISFAIDAGTFLASALFLARIRTALSSAPAERSTVLAELRAGWQEFRSRSWLWVTVAYTAVFYFFVVAPFVVLGPFAAAKHLGGAGAWAAIAVGYGIGSIGGSLAAIKLRPHRPLVVACALLLPFALDVGLLAVQAPLAVIVAGATTGGFGIGVFNALYLTVLQEHVPQRSLSRVVAYDWLGSTAALPFGYVCSGAVASVVGLRSELLAAAVVGVAAVAAVCSLPTVRRLRARASSPADVAGGSIQDAPPPRLEVAADGSANLASKPPTSAITP